MLVFEIGKGKGKNTPQLWELRVGDWKRKKREGQKTGKGRIGTATYIRLQEGFVKLVRFLVVSLKLD